MVPFLLLTLGSLLVLTLLVAVTGFVSVRFHRELVMLKYRVHRARQAIAAFDEETQEENEESRLWRLQLDEELSQAERGLSSRMDNPVARWLSDWMEPRAS